MERLINITGKALSGEWGIDDEEGIGIPVLRTTNFTNDGIIDYSNVITRTITKKNIADKFLRKGDIIIEKSGGSDNKPVGRVVYFDNDENKYLFNNFTGLLRVKDTTKWLPKYIFYSLFANYQSGGTRRYENKTTGLHNLQTDFYVKDFEIKEISYGEQIEICELFDGITDLIDKRKRQLEKLDELVKSRFIEMFDGKYKMVKLGDVVKTTSGGTPSKAHPEYYENGTIPWLTSGEVNAGIITSVKNHITDIGMKNSSAKMVPANSVVIAMYGATAGVTGLIRLDTTTNQAVCSILPSERFVPEYLYYAVASKKEWMISQCQGGGQPNISQGIIKNMDVIDAPIEEQIRFATFVEQTDKLKFEIKQSLEKLELLKKALMQKYFG